MVLMAGLLDLGPVARQGWQRRRGAIGHADLVRVQRQRHHGVIADQRGEFDDAGGAMGSEDALVGRVTGVMAPQQFGGVVVDGLLVLCLERAAAVPQGLDRPGRQSRLPRLGFVGVPLELAVPEAPGQQDDELAQARGKTGVEAQDEAEVGPFFG
jgi:hypothetical protein